MVSGTVEGTVGAFNWWLGNISAGAGYPAASVASTTLGTRIISFK